MFRKTARRGIAALAFVTVLAFAGAQPAAAADLGLLDRIASFWSAGFDEGVTGLWDAVTAWFGGMEKTDGLPVTTERGVGSDPNGVDSTPAPAEPVVPGDLF